MIYRNVTFKEKVEYDALIPISINTDPNSTTEDEKMSFIKPPRGGSNPIADRKTNSSWYMEYHRIKKKSCFKQCQEIDHAIPSIDIIESGKMRNIEKDF